MERHYGTPLWYVRRGSFKTLQPFIEEPDYIGWKTLTSLRSPQDPGKS